MRVFMLAAGRSLGKALAVLLRGEAPALPSAASAAPLPTAAGAAAVDQSALPPALTQLQLFLEHAPVELAMFDREMRYLAVSRRWVDDYGLDATQVIGRSHYAVFPEIPERWKALHRRALAGETLKSEEDRFVRADGRVQWLRWELRPWYERSGAIGGIVIFSEDISARKAAEQALRRQQALRWREQRRARLAALNLMEDAVRACERAEAATAALRASEQRLLLAQEAAHVGIWEWDFITDRPAYWSPEFERLYGFEPGCMRGIEDWRARVHPADLARIEARVAQLSAQDPVLDEELRVLWPSGAVRWLMTRGRLECDASGRRLRLLGINLDITARKQAVEEIQTLNAELERRVSERTAALVAARNEAERLAQIKSDFLANMSHEIRTPLNAVLGLARIGWRDSSAAPALQRIFDQIIAAGTHLLAVINDILDFSKIEAGRFTLDQAPFSLAAIVANASSLLAISARRKGLVYRTLLAPELPTWVLGDARRLQQILVNLLANAVKFTEQGEVTLEVRRAGAEIAFIVTDTGIGMDAAQQARLFQPFEQADCSTTRRYGGTGLGLAISHELAKLMGGQIRVVSTLGVGSTFTLTVPLPDSAPPATPHRAAPSASGPRLRGLRVLAAEDIEVNRLILEDLLTQEGATVCLVADGRAAVERIAAAPHAFDVVLMDIQMPVMDGYAATDKIRALAPDVPVIGLTAHALPEERDRCRAAGMVEHVPKPIDPDQLVAAILHHVRGDPVATSAPPAVILSPTRSATAIDWEALQRRFGHREAFIDRLLELAAHHHADTLQQLRAAQAARDFQTIVFIAHALKGLGGNLEASRLRDLGQRTESAARAGAAETWALVTELTAALEAVLSELAQHRTTGASDGLSSGSG